MYGDSPGFSVLVNTEVDSMGGVIDDGVGLQDKTSPRRAAIEKAQAELRQEYFVREVRKRELEFLEKGGNPLDFKFGPTTPVSIQSMSLTDQLLDYDAKGSSALAASPHGDSVDSSGRPGAALGREQNTADNLLLIDGQNSNHDGTKNEIRSGRRKTIASSEHSSKQDGSNVKESEESGVFRFGVKSQAYARRNRSRPSRDNAYLGSAHVASSTHGNSSSLFPSSVNSRDKKSPLLETQVEENAVSSISNSKPASPSGNNLSRALDIDDQVAMEIDASEAQETSRLMQKVDVREGEAEVTTSNYLQQNGCNENAKAADEQCSNGTISLPCELTIGEALSAGAATEPILTDDNMGNTMKSNPVCSKNVVHLQNQEQFDKHRGDQTINDALTSKDVETQPLNANGSADSHGGQKLKPECDGTLMQDGHAIEKSDLNTIDVHSVGDKEPSFLSHELANSHVQVKHEELTDSNAYLQSEGRHGLAQKGGKPGNSLCDSTSADPKGFCPPSSLPISVCGPSNPNLYERTSSSTSQLPFVPGKNLKLSKKACEDAILKEARIVEAKLKRVNELSLYNFPSEKRCKSHWDYVIEEMAWLANDFTQERIWKIAAASQISRFIASSGRSKFEKENLCRKQRKDAHSMAKAVMSFWQLAEVLRTGGKSNADVDKQYHSSLFLSWKRRGRDAANKQVEGGENLEEGGSAQTVQIPILGYAVRFLKCNNSCDHPLLAEAPVTPERVSDAGVWGVSMEDQSSEDNLFYLVPAGAMNIYRESIESSWLQHEKARKMSHREDCEASTCDSLPEYVPRENAFEEDEAETSIQYLPGVFESTRPSNFSHKKKKILQEKTYGASAYELRSDLPYGAYLENRLVTQPSLQIGKRPVSTFGVCSIPTKRMRTASRQRIVSPFSTGNAGGMQVASKTSSGDTSSFQDDQSSLQYGSHTKKHAEVESTADFEKTILFDGTDIFNRSKKRKKLKHMGYNNLITTDVLLVSKGSSYEHRWQDDTMSQHDQDRLNKRLESHHFDSNGNPVIQGQHTLKKPKLLKQLSEASPETFCPATGSIPSPAASQMSSMSNPNKLIKMIAGRDRGRKNKALKITAGQLGSAGSWSQFEDQALVVLVHDMGRNWELVSDVINSALQFKCIFRKPNECKERHKVLMDRSAGDGADSAEDSGSSQSYPSTLPGIPKGSARQLFQRLQGPMEEDSLKAHFEKIILIGRQLHFRRKQGESKEMKQMTSVHSSHLHALSQACPSNLTGSPLTPLDLCEITPSPEPLGLGYQGSHPNGLPMTTHPGALAPGMTTSGPNSMLLGAPGLGMNNGLPSTPPIAPTRESQRYGIPRLPPFPVDEQQRMQQQYSQMLSGRNMQQPSMPIPGALLPMGTDRNVHMLSGGNNMGMMCGMNSGMPMSRPSFQGIGSPGVPNMATSGSALPSGGVGMSSPVNAHASNVTGQGNSLLRPHDHLQMPRPPQNREDHKQMMMQDLQLQVTQGTCQSVAPVSGMSTTFSSQGTPPSPIQTFSAQQHQQPHQISQQSHLFGSSHHPQIQGTNQMNPQQQAYAMRLAKERQQIQQRLLHQQHQFSGSNAVTPSQNSSQISQQSQSPAAASISAPQAHNKQPNMARSPLPGGSMPNQMINQRQRQQLHQQQPRHQQQRQQPQQQGNLSKGLGGGNMLMYQNVPLDASHVNTPAVTSNKVNERHLLQQGQGLFTGGSASGSSLPQSSSQQKIYVRPPPRSSKSVPSMSTHPDACNQSLVQGPPNHSLVASQQSSLPPLPLASQQQQRQTNHSQQAMQRMMLQQNHHVNSDGQGQSTVDSVQVNQMIVTNPASQCPDTGNNLSVATSSPLSASHWKPEPSYDTTIPTPAIQLATSPQQSIVGTEATVTPLNQGLTKRPFSGSLPMRLHSIGGQWQQPKQPPQPPPQDQKKQQHPPPQHQQQQHQPSQHQQPH